MGSGGSSKNETFQMDSVSFIFPPTVARFSFVFEFGSGSLEGSHDVGGESKFGDPVLFVPAPIQRHKVDLKAPCQILLTAISTHLVN